MAYLIIERAGVIVERRKLDRDRFTIGRAPDNDIVLDDPQIGAHLAHLEQEGSSYVFVDAGSVAGVTYQNERITRLPLCHQMRLDAFPFTFVYQDEGEIQEKDIGVGTTEATVAMDLAADTEGLELICLNKDCGPFKLKGGVNIVGRRSGIDITVESKMVSNEHAHLIVLPGEVVVEDRHSSNGTYVNRKRIDRAPLRDGDMVQFGDAEFKLVAPTLSGGKEGVLETQDIEVSEILTGSALSGQVGKVDAKPPKRKKKLLRVALLGCVGSALALLLIVVVLSTMRHPPAPPPVDPGLKLKLEQARVILESRDKLDVGMKLVEEVLAARAAKGLHDQANELKAAIETAMKEPPPLEKMTPDQLLAAASKILESGHILKSIPYYERLVTLDPAYQNCGSDYATLMYDIGLVYEGADNETMATKVWSRALAVLPADSGTFPAIMKIKTRLRAHGVSV